jgi:arylsulfatase A-like enzyme
LGEEGVWGKHTLHEVALRSPLIIRTPEMISPGIASDALIESVDIYPTLAELCGLRAPSRLSGVSFVPAISNPNADGKPAVFGFWRGGRAHSIRTPRYRLTQWTDGSDRTKVLQTELYDHDLDPDETANVAGEHLGIVQELSAQLRSTVPVLKSR